MLPLHGTTLLQKLTVQQLVTNAPYFIEHEVACPTIRFFLRILFDIILPSLHRSSNSIFPSHILTKTLCVFLFCLQICHVPHPPHPHLITLVILGEEATQYAVPFSFLFLPLFMQGDKFVIIFVELFELCGIFIFYWFFILYLKAYMLIP